MPYSESGFTSPALAEQARREQLGAMHQDTIGVVSDLGRQLAVGGDAAHRTEVRAPLPCARTRMQTDAHASRACARVPWAQTCHAHVHRRGLC